MVTHIYSMFGVFIKQNRVFENLREGIFTVSLRFQFSRFSLERKWFNPNRTFFICSTLCPWLPRGYLIYSIISNQTGKNCFSEKHCLKQMPIKHTLYLNILRDTLIEEHYITLKVWWEFKGLKTIITPASCVFIASCGEFHLFWRLSCSIWGG